ncbi:MAG: hypothetical protein LBH25_02575 [Fibromonadaceae bacterium]|jgi:uncharacterized protein involved in exopolysaccharide biosynthesis|nr:hypothetical protein [Fibromonadaceae bacterium]
MPPTVEEEDIDLSRIVARILRHKMLAAIVAVIAFIGAVAYAKLAPRFYETKIKFVYQSAKQQGGNLSALAALAGFSVGGASDDGSAYMEDIVKSTDFLSPFTSKEWFIADTNKIADTLSPITLENFWEIEMDSIIINDRERILQASLIGKILKYKYIKYEQDKKTGIITITTQFEDPKLSYEFNVAIFEELNNTLMNKMRSKAAENRKFIEERLLEVKEDLKRAEEILLGFQQRNRSAQMIDPSIKLYESRLMREVTINQELALQLQKQYELAKIEEARDMPLLDIIESPRRALWYSKPKTKIIMVAGLISGVFLGLMAALGFDLWCSERKSIMEQIEKAKKEIS